MLAIKQDVILMKPGQNACHHLFFPRKGNINWGEKMFSQERICTKCGRYELATTRLISKRIGFKDIVEHFHN